jgi:hypothetical protein
MTQTKVIISCAHFSFGESNSAFETALKIKSFTLSTAPLLSRWLTEATVIEPTKLQDCKYKNNHQSDQIPVLKLP